ncbi:MAG: hypothetical protein GY918_05945, partial [Gammaproteobacteria bacterium]|nr:hypothetical protein [Gammaproteobacteria bacterium]
STGDKLTVRAYKSFTTADMVPASTGGTFGGDVEVSGTLTADGLDLGDNDKATFGASDDLKIYHDGSHSYIQDSGTGNLRITAQNFNVRNAANNANMITAADGGSTYLYNDGDLKLATSSSGIDVTGTAEAHKVEIGDGSAGGTSEILFSDNVSARGKILYDHSSNPETLLLQTTGTTAISVDNAQNVSIPNGNLDVTGTVSADGLTVSDSSGAGSTLTYGTWGTTTWQYNGVDAAKIDPTSNSFFTNNVGIGTSSPATTLEVKSNATNDFITLQHTSGPKSYIGNSSVGSLVLSADEGNSGNTSRIEMKVDGTERLRIDSSGRVGIGTSSPSQDLHIREDSGDCNLLIDSANGASQIFFGDDESVNIGNIRYDHGSNYMRFSANGTERMRIDSSGNVGIGTSSPSSALTVSGSIPNAPTGDGVHLGLTSNYAQMQLNGSSGGIIDFSTSGVDHIGRILYDQGYDYMRFDTNYAERMRIDSSGNVGIGTSSPSAKLSIENTGSSTVNAITLDWEHLSTTTNIEQRIQWRFGDDATADTFLNAGYIGAGKEGSWQSGAGRDSYLSLGTTNNNTQTEAMRIDSSGNLLVGCTDTTPARNNDAGGMAFTAGG